MSRDTALLLTCALCLPVFSLVGSIGEDLGLPMPLAIFSGVVTGYIASVLFNLSWPKDEEERRERR